MAQEAQIGKKQTFWSRGRFGYKLRQAAKFLKPSGPKGQKGVERSLADVAADYTAEFEGGRVDTQGVKELDSTGQQQTDSGISQLTETVNWEHNMSSYSSICSKATDTSRALTAGTIMYEIPIAFTAIFAN